MKGVYCLVCRRSAGGQCGAINRHSAIVEGEKMRNFIACVVVLLCAGSGVTVRQTSAAPDMTFTLPASPDHQVFLDFDFGWKTYVLDIWNMEHIPWPAMDGLTGDFTIRIQAPAGFRIVTTAGAQLSAFLQWQAFTTAAFGGYVDQPATATLLGLVGPAAADPTGGSAVGVPPEAFSSTLSWLTIKSGTTNLLPGTGFSAMEITFPIDTMAATFPSTSELSDPDGTFRLVFSQVLADDRTGEPNLIAQYTFLEPVPEPGTLALLAIGAAVLVRRRRQARR